MYQINSLKEMKKFATWMASKLIKNNPFDFAQGKGALVLALSGDLGSGKTTFAQYFLRALGVKGKITSPTFVLSKRYTLNAKRYAVAYHIDCYRIHKPGDFKVFDLKDILNVSQNIVLIEWPERIKRALPNPPAGGAIWLKFEHGEKPNQRTIKIN